MTAEQMLNAGFCRQSRNWVRQSILISGDPQTYLYSVSRKVELLIIDDDDDYHFFIDKALEEITVCDVGGHKLFHAKDLAGFLMDTGYRPDAIIMDINMPYISGFEAIKDLHKSDQLKNIPVFLLTNSSSITDRLRCYELGCAGFYTKPDDATEYKDILNEIISKLNAVSM